MQLYLLGSVLSAVFVTAAAVAHRDVAVAEAWLRSHWSESTAQPDMSALGELKSANPEAFAIVQALMAKRSLGLLKPRMATTFSAPTPETRAPGESQLVAPVPAATSAPPESAPKPAPRSLRLAPESSGSVSSKDSSDHSGSVTWSNAFSWGPGTRVKSDTGGGLKSDPAIDAVHKLYDTRPTQRPDQLASFHWEDGATLAPVTTSFLVTTTTQPSQEHLSSWLGSRTVSKAETKMHQQSSMTSGSQMQSSPNTPRHLQTPVQSSPKASLSTVARSTKQSSGNEYMDMLGPIDDSQPQSADADMEDSEQHPVPVAKAVHHDSKRFPLESFSWDDDKAERVQHVAAHLAHAQSGRTATVTKRVAPKLALRAEQSDESKAHRKARMQLTLPPSPDASNPYLKSLNGLNGDDGLSASPAPHSTATRQNPRFNPYLAALD